MRSILVLLFVGVAYSFPSVKEIPYKVVEKTDDYELRSYGGMKYVCTEMKDLVPSQDPLNGWEKKYHNIAWLAMNSEDGRKEPMNKMFMKLFGYISGQNKAGQKIAMTSPVPMEHLPSKPDLEDEAMCFWLDIEEEAPEPKDKDVFLVEVPAFQVYVKKFGGFALSDDDFRKPYNELKSMLLEAGKSVEEGKWTSLSYDPPFKPLFRRNEVWIQKL